MTDVVIACDYAGRKLDELPVAIQRDYKITRGVDAGKGNFQIPANHPKATWRNLRYGNLIYVASDQAGIQEWAAMVWPPEPNGTTIRDGVLTIQLRSVEWLLALRATNEQEIVRDKAGRIFLELLNVARREGYLPISTTNVSTSNGRNVLRREYNLMAVYEAVNQLADDTDAYWWLQPYIDPTNNALNLQPNWKYKRSSVFRNQLSTGGTNPNFAISEIGEAAEIANHVKAYGRAESWDDPVTYESRDRTSIGRFRQVYTKILPCLDETTVDGLRPIVDRYLKENAYPRLKINGTVLRAPFPRAGDVTDVLLTDGNSFITEQRGSTVKMQVENARYDPLDNTLVVHLEEIIG